MPEVNRVGRTLLSVAFDSDFYTDVRMERNTPPGITSS